MGRSKRKDRLPGGLADRRSPDDFDRGALAKGTKVELEHTSDPDLAMEIAMDHLAEDPRYYEKLAKMEAEMTTSTAALRDRLANDDLDWVQQKYRELGISPRGQVLTALGDAGFTLEHTGGGTYLWQLEVGRMTVSIGPELPQLLSDQILVNVEDSRGRSVGFWYPKLSTFLSTLNVVG